MTTTKKRSAPLGCIDCNMLRYEVEMLVVDELGQPLPNVPYVLWIGYGPAKKLGTRRGQTNDKGILLAQELPPGPLFIVFEADALAEVLQEPHRHLRLSRSDDGTPVQKEAEQRGRLYRYARIGLVMDKLPTLIEEEQRKAEKIRQPLPVYHFPHGDPALLKKERPILYTFSNNAEQRIKMTLEITPFRAWVLMLEHTPDYQLGNAHNLALMAALAYADGKANEAYAKDVRKQPAGYKPTDNQRARSIEHFFVEQMQDLARLPNGVNHLIQAALVVDVPYRDRYQTPVFIDVTTPGDNGEAPPRGMFGIKFDTQFFYVTRPGEMIVSWRGTASGADDLADLNFTPVPCQGMEIASQGKAHEGFYRQFEVVTEHPKAKIAEVYQTIIHLLNETKDTRLYICGHSLGGALALLHAASLRTYNPLLYTYGMPRTLTESALHELTFSHFRHRNELDKVTSLPPGRGMDSPLGRVPVAGKVIATVGLLVPDVDPFGHHGKLVHFNYTDTQYIGRKERGYDVPFPLPVHTKMLLAPHLAAEGNVPMPEKAKAALADAYPPGDNPSHGGGADLDSHPSGEYVGYLQARLLGLLDEQHSLPDPYVQKLAKYVRALGEYKTHIAPEVNFREHGAAQLDHQLRQLLPVARTEPEQFAITRLWQAPRKQRNVS